MTTAVFMAVWMAISITRIWEILFPCAIIFVLIQAIIAVVSSIIFYRTYKIMYKLAVQKKAQIMMMLLQRNNQNVEAVFDKDNYSEEETWCISHIELLRPRHALVYCILQGILIMAFFFMVPANYTLEARVSCPALSSLVAVVFLLILFIVVLIGFRGLRMLDNFNMIKEITYCAGGIASTFPLLLIVTLLKYLIHDGQTIRDLQVDVGLLQQGIVIIVTVLLPGVWALRLSREIDSQKGEILKPDLLRVLAHDESLELFKNHLIKEWAVENLLFYEDVIKIQAERGQKIISHELQLRRFYFIYRKYISVNASFEVNLSGQVVSPIHAFFKRASVMGAIKLMRSRLSRMNSQNDKKTDTKFELSSIFTRKGGSVSSRSGRSRGSAIVQNSGDIKNKMSDEKKNNLPGADEKKNNLPGAAGSPGGAVSFRYDAWNEEIMGYLSRAKDEVFKLLCNDSYKRFVGREDVQRHFRQFQGVLMSADIKRKSEVILNHIDRRTRHVRSGSPTHDQAQEVPKLKEKVRRTSKPHSENDDDDFGDHHHQE
eukprot:CAMPEP_0197517296 /NCGR_PEP_ID=MMETSP1318-20131121/2291_1 /TAXON_ID=552666 /ORGANISM="Partenskyella glossopodia, Strain RCC365" /LENGTH=541 /DNA_ID=CAMNT_0043066747 /DNA_START=446 /DNA_END=2071 /DNA_ORIENTATION=-